MRYITEQYWASFKDGGRFNGVMFEDLVRLLLPRIQAGRWRRTKASHDGSRDFYHRGKNGHFWAEAKMYRESVSIRVLSPTLVMALMQNVNVVMFFSYSRLNSNAVRHLSQYQKVTGKRIEIYDDEALESLILNCPRALRFFPSFRVPEDAAPGGLVFSWNFSKDPDVEYLDVDEEQRLTDRTSIRGLSTFCIDLFARNLNPESGTRFTLRLEPEAWSGRFRLLNREFREHGYAVAHPVERSGVTLVRLYFQVIGNGGRIELPALHLEVSEERLKVIQPGMIDVSSIFATPLVGKQATEAVARFREHMTARARPVAAVVHGRSGTGKSRLLYEFRNEMLADGCHVHSFSGEDGRPTTFDEWIRPLVSKLYQLPLAPVDDPLPPPRASPRVPRDHRAHSVLYDASAPSAQMPLCLEVVRSALREQKVAVLVDNVQNYDDTTLRFLNELVAGFRDGHGRAVLVLSFNCDFVLPGTRAQALRDRLVGLARDGGQSAFAEFQLGDFSREDFYAFLDHCVSVRDGGATTFTYRFGQTAALLHQRVQSRPLFLEQMLLHLEERRVLRREQDRLYLEDIPAFHRELDALPAKFRGVMEKRWAFVRKAVGPPAEQLLRTLVFLVAAPLWLLEKAGCSTETVLALEARGLIRLTERDRVTFYHNQVFRFFDDVLKRPDATLAGELLPLLGAPGVRDDYYLQWFLARDVAGALTHEDVADGVHEARRKMGRDERSHDFLRALERRLRRSDVQVEPTTRLETLVWLCGELKHAHFAERLEAFEKLWSGHVRPMEESYREIGPTYFYFVREFANAHFSIHADPKALPLLRSTADRLKEFGFPDEESRARWTAEILNRLCVVYKSIGQKDDAVDCARRSLRLARVARHLPMQIFNRVDWGYVYYGFAGTRQALVEQWRPAVSLFERSRRARPEVEGLRSMIRVKEVVLQMLDGRMNDAATLAMQEAHYCETILEAFYRVRYLMAFVVCKLTAANADHGELQAIVEDAQDWCVRFQADRSYWNTFYVESKVRAAAGDQYGSVVALQRAFEQLQKTLAQPSMEWLYAAFYEDLALQLRRMTGEVPNEILQGVGSHETRRLVGRTAEMSDAQFAAWMSTYTPSAAFQDGRFNLPTP